MFLGAAAEKSTFKSITEHITLEFIYVSWSSSWKPTFKSINEHITLELIYVSWSSIRKSTFKSMIEHITLDLFMFIVAGLGNPHLSQWSNTSH